MKRIIRAWNKTNLIKRIGFGMTIGAILGLFVPNVSGIDLLGDLFVGGLKAILLSWSLPSLLTPSLNTKKAKIVI